MLKVTLLLIVINSSLTPVMLHPISLGGILMIQTILTCLFSRMILNSSWIPATIFLVMVGGLMILFTYITSICSNKKFLFKKINSAQFVMMATMAYYMTMMEMDKFTDSTLNLKDTFNMEFIKLFLPMNIVSSNFMFIYLLIMLMIMISILPLSNGPLRKKY